MRTRQIYGKIENIANHLYIDIVVRYRQLFTRHEQCDSLLNSNQFEANKKQTKKQNSVND